MLLSNKFDQISFKQSDNSCVLASYAIAAYPFTGQNVNDYFYDYYNHFGLVPITKPNVDYFFYHYHEQFGLIPMGGNQTFEQIYNFDFHKQCSSGKNGYKIIQDLHFNSNEKTFVNARSKFDIEYVDDSQNRITEIEYKLKVENDLVVNLFLNKSYCFNPQTSDYYINSSHSITIGFDHLGFYIYDVNQGKYEYMRGLKSIAELGELGNGFLIKGK